MVKQNPKRGSRFGGNYSEQYNTEEFGDEDGSVTNTSTKNNAQSSSSVAYQNKGMASFFDTISKYSKKPSSGVDYEYRTGLRSSSTFRSSADAAVVVQRAYKDLEKAVAAKPGSLSPERSSSESDRDSPGFQKIQDVVDGDGPIHNAADALIGACIEDSNDYQEPEDPLESRQVEGPVGDPVNDVVNDAALNEAPLVIQNIENATDRQEPEDPLENRQVDPVDDQHVDEDEHVHNSTDALTKVCIDNGNDQREPENPVEIRPAEDPIDAPVDDVDGDGHIHNGNDTLVEDANVEQDNEDRNEDAIGRQEPENPAENGQVEDPIDDPVDDVNGDGHIHNTALNEAPLVIQDIEEADQHPQPENPVEDRQADDPVNDLHVDVEGLIDNAADVLIEVRIEDVNDHQEPEDPLQNRPVEDPVDDLNVDGDGQIHNAAVNEPLAIQDIENANDRQEPVNPVENRQDEDDEENPVRRQLTQIKDQVVAVNGIKAVPAVNEILDVEKQVSTNIDPIGIESPVSLPIEDRFAKYRVTRVMNRGGKTIVSQRFPKGEVPMVFVYQSLGVAIPPNEKKEYEASVVTFHEDSDWFNPRQPKGRHAAAEGTMEYENIYGEIIVVQIVPIKGNAEVGGEPGILMMNGILRKLPRKSEPAPMEIEFDRPPSVPPTSICQEPSDEAIMRDVAPDQPVKDNTHVVPLPVEVTNLKQEELQEPNNHHQRAVPNGEGSSSSASSSSSTQNASSSQTPTASGTSQNSNNAAESSDAPNLVIPVPIVIKQEIEDNDEEFDYSDIEVLSVKLPAPGPRLRNRNGFLRRGEPINQPQPVAEDIQRDAEPVAALDPVDTLPVVPVEEAPMTEAPPASENIQQNIHQNSNGSSSTNTQAQPIIDVQVQGNEGSEQENGQENPVESNVAEDRQTIPAQQELQENASDQDIAARDEPIMEEPAVEEQAIGQENVDGSDVAEVAEDRQNIRAQEGVQKNIPTSDQDQPIVAEPIVVQPEIAVEQHEEQETGQENPEETNVVEDHQVISLQQGNQDNVAHAAPIMEQLAGNDQAEDAKQDNVPENVDHQVIPVQQEIQNNGSSSNADHQIVAPAAPIIQQPAVEEQAIDQENPVESNVAVDHQLIPVQEEVQNNIIATEQDQPIVAHPAPIVQQPGIDDQVDTIPVVPTEPEVVEDHVNVVRPMEKAPMTEAPPAPENIQQNEHQNANGGSSSDQLIAVCDAQVQGREGAEQANGQNNLVDRQIIPARQELQGNIIPSKEVQPIVTHAATIVQKPAEQNRHPVESNVAVNHQMIPVQQQVQGFSISTDQPQSIAVVRRNDGAEQANGQNSLANGNRPVIRAQRVQGNSSLLTNKDRADRVEKIVRAIQKPQGNALRAASVPSGASTSSGPFGASTSGPFGESTSSGPYGASTSGPFGASTSYPSGPSGASTSGYSGASTSSGPYGASTSGPFGASTSYPSGPSGASTSGYSGASTSSGPYGASTSGPFGASTSGPFGASTSSGPYGASTSGPFGASTSSYPSGPSGASTFPHGASTSGPYGASTSSGASTQPQRPVEAVRSRKRDHKQMEQEGSQNANNAPVPIKSARIETEITNPENNQQEAAEQIVDIPPPVLHVEAAPIQAEPQVVPVAQERPFAIMRITRRPVEPQLLMPQSDIYLSFIDDNNWDYIEWTPEELIEFIKFVLNNNLEAQQTLIQYLIDEQFDGSLLEVLLEEGNQCNLPMGSWRRLVSACNGLINNAKLKEYRFDMALYAMGQRENEERANRQ